MNRKTVLTLILTLMVISGAGIGGYYWYEGQHYVKTEDARVAGDIYRIMPRISGKITSLAINDGDPVVSDQIVGQQDTTNLPTNLLDNAALRAPITGTVLKTLAKVGEVVSPGQAVAMVVDESKLYISANIEETEVGRLQLGQKVDIEIDAFPGKQLVGHVSEIGQATNSTFSLLPASNTSGNFTKVTQRIPIKIAIDTATDIDLSTGMNAFIKIEVKGI
ncbi:efflux RND transporter periplasmic adaptor subunit [Brevibacillus migulae]|uniref:efflux RND transporter periplasmic adaptor subunit n=1 Tax=Brevibacillus migulae TaxID=1644114 RepID=UPI00106E5C80|nr:efflux RND transporter periplasmic adaptor subunit [Brevibacillus migulae]